MPAHRDPVRAMRDCGVEVVAMQSAEGEHGHPRAGDCAGEALPSERRCIGVRRRSEHGAEDDQINVQCRRMHHFGMRMTRRGHQQIARPRCRGGQRRGGPVNARAAKHPGGVGIAIEQHARSEPLRNAS